MIAMSVKKDNTWHIIQRFTLTRGKL